MRGRWAAGIMPRNFAWIVQDRLAVSERPGGYAPHHRRVRRQEEILWLEANGFTRVVSLLPSSHNLHAYEELGLPSAHFGLPPQADVRAVLAELYPAMLGWIRDGERLLLHQEELNERVGGVVAGFLCWCGIPSDPTRAIYAVEQLLRRQLGSAGRSIVVLAEQIAPPDRRSIEPNLGPRIDPDLMASAAERVGVTPAAVLSSGEDGSDVATPAPAKPRRRPAVKRVEPG